MYPIDQECILTKPDRFSKTDCAHKSIKPLPQKELETQRRLYRTRLLQITMDGQTSRMMRPSWSTMFYQWSRSTRSWKTPRFMDDKVADGAPVAIPRKRGWFFRRRR